MLKLQGWIFHIFGIKSKLKKCKKKKAFRIDLDNKIVVRYLNKFLGFPLGEKTYTVTEPKLIKNSNLKFRIAFLCGFMTFEGHVLRKTRNIQVSCKSKKIIRGCHEILSKLLPMKKIKLDNYGRWICISKSLNKKNLVKALSFFEKDTMKWDRLSNKVKNAKL